MNDKQTSTEHKKSASFLKRWWKKLTLLVVMIAVLAAVYINFGDYLFGSEGKSFLDQLADQQSRLEEYQKDHPLLVYGIAFLAYVTVAALSIPVATVFTLVFGWYFGFWRALLLVSFASALGASLAFLFSRYLLRDAIQKRFGERLDKFNAVLKEEGPFYLFTLRLIGVVPYFVVNLVMGLTPIRLFQFWWVSQIGMLPGTVVYVNAGASVPDLQTLADNGLKGILSPQLLVGFVLLGLFPIATKKIMARYRGSKPGEPASEMPSDD